MSLNDSPWVTPASEPAAVRPSRIRVRKRSVSSVAAAEPVVADVHRGLELAGVGEQRRQLGVGAAGDVLDVVGLVGLEQQQRVGTVVGQPVLGEEVRIAGRHDAVDRQPAGVAVVGVEPVALPRVVAEHDVGSELADDACDLAPPFERRLELAVDAAEEHDLAGGAERLGGRALLVLALRDQRGGVGVGVPGALRAVGEHEVRDDAARRRPLGERGAAVELDVVGVGDDGQRRRRASGGRRCTAGTGRGRTGSRRAAGSFGSVPSVNGSAGREPVGADEVVGDVDVPGQPHLALDPQRPGRAGPPRPGGGRTSPGP